MKENKQNIKLVFAAGGTGGHLYPALAVADYIKDNYDDVEIRFIGANGKIESKVVPEAGYTFKPIIISGIRRNSFIKNISFAFKLFIGTLQSLLYLIKYKPSVAIGAGAYISAPVIWASKFLGAKIVLLEQNSYPGLVNRLFEKKANVIFLSFKESEKYFREKGKLKYSGNPVRVELNNEKKENALKSFNLKKDKTTLLVLGGSLGAERINNAVEHNLEKIRNMGFQIIWQTGKNYYKDLEKYNSDDVKVFPFIADMNKTYSSSDIVLARAGATTIAELAIMQKASILVPSPNVVANHQYINAKSLFDANAAELLEDDEVVEQLPNLLSSLIKNEERIKELQKNIENFARKDAKKIIAEEIIKLAKVSF